ncbi:hypothetical protein LMG33818_000066 [Halomonadaceae bacterium LMG 33818]|uniref:hypothetical protein n=1 Tax=Cernens ardua TaxID=3402176 RepID=UPI003EDC33E1
MDNSNIPSKVTVVFASQGNYNQIAETSSADSLASGQATMDVGFPPLTMTAVANGGKPPSGKDMNGILHDIYLRLQLQSIGYMGAYDSSFSSTVGGYPAGASVCDTSTGTLWLNTQDSNTNLPTADNSGWLPVGRSWDQVTGKPDFGNASLKNASAVNWDKQDVSAFENDTGEVVSGADLYQTIMHLATVARSGSYSDLNNIPAVLSALSYSGSNAVRLTGQYGDALQIEGGNVFKVLDNNGNINWEVNEGVLDIGNVPAARITGLPDWLAAQTVGSIGSYALLRRNDGNYHYAGDIVPGSSLNYASAGEFESSGTAPGSWRAMGQTNNHGGADGDEVTLFLRVS